MGLLRGIAICGSRSSSDRTLHPDAARTPLVLKQTLPGAWHGQMQLNLTGAVAYWTPTGGVPIALSSTFFANEQLPQTIYLEGNGCGMGEASFSIAGSGGCATNTPLQIFGANATLAGVAEADEESPGGFIAARSVHANVPRTMLALEACGPYGSPGNLILGWDSSVVNIYTTPSGGSALTQFVTPFHGFNGTNLYVEGIAPGATTLNWTYSAQTNCTDNIQVSVIRVETIQPDSMPNLQEIDDGDGNSKTRIFIVPIAEPMEYPVIPVTVRATIAPSLSESQLPADWTLQGGIGTEKLTRTISRAGSAGASKTEFTFTCGGTDSGLKTTVYVYEAKVGLFADEGDLQNIDVGHSWGRYSLDAYARELIPQHLRPYLQEIGFWPSIAGNANCAGDVRLGAGAVGAHWPSGWKEYPICFSSLALALPQVKASDDSPPWYNLLNYNCTDYAIGIGEIVNIYTMDASGVSTPWVFSSWLNTH